MINAAVITRAMRDLLKNNLPSTYVIERGEYINQDYEKTPWIGVYRGDIDYDVQTLGRGANTWKAEFTVRVIIQSSSLKSAEQAEDELEGHIEATLDVIMSDKTIGGTVNIVKGTSVKYSYNETESEEIYFQNAELSILTEVRTS